MIMRTMAIARKNWRWTDLLAAETPKFSRYLSRACGRNGLALRPRGSGGSRHHARRCMGDLRMAARDDVHRFPVEPGRGRAGADAIDHDHRTNRHLWPVRARRPARRRGVARILPQVAAAGRDRRGDGFPVAASVILGPGGPT